MASATAATYAAADAEPADARAADSGMVGQSDADAGPAIEADDSFRVTCASTHSDPWTCCHPYLDLYSKRVSHVLDWSADQGPTSGRLYYKAPRDNLPKWEFALTPRRQLSDLDLAEVRDATFFGRSAVDASEAFKENGVSVAVGDVVLARQHGNRSVVYALYVTELEFRSACVRYRVAETAGARWRWRSDPLEKVDAATPPNVRGKHQLLSRDEALEALAPILGPKPRGVSIHIWANDMVTFGGVTINLRTGTFEVRRGDQGWSRGSFHRADAGGWTAETEHLVMSHPGPKVRE
jgi:hypothetical protein